MGLMGSWSGFNFEVSPYVVRGFNGLTIKSGSETEDKVSDKYKYVERKNSTVTEIGLSVDLNAYMGCNVREESASFLTAATEGESAYFYVGGKKLIPNKLMLTAAEVSEIQIAPDGTWVSSTIKLTFKMCEKIGGGSGGSGGSGSSGSSSKKTGKESTKQEQVTTTPGATGTLTGGLERALAAVNRVINAAKVETRAIKGGGGVFMEIAMK